MKIPAVILVFLAVVACQPAETVPGEIDPARSDPVRSDPVRSDRAKPAAEKTVVESALVTVIEEVEMPAKVLHVSRMRATVPTRVRGMNLEG